MEDKKDGYPLPTTDYMQLKNDEDRLCQERVLSAYQDAIDNQEVQERVDHVGDREGDSLIHQDEDNPWSWSSIKLSVQFASFYFLLGLAPSLLLPYLSVYYKQLGLNPGQIGVVKSIQPWIAIPAIPLGGCIADRLNVTRIMLMVTLIGYIVGNTVIAITPRVRQVDCATAMSRICAESQSQVQTPLVLSSTALLPSVDDLTTAIYQNSRQNYTVCQPNSQYTTLFYNTGDLLNLYIYFIVISALGEIWQAPAPALGNAAVLNRLGKKKRNQYGYYKAAGAVGAAFGVFIAGLVVDGTEKYRTHCGVHLSHVDYSICFIGFAICVIVALPIGWFLYENEEVSEDRKPKKFYFAGVIWALCNVRYGSALLAITWLSIAVGVAKSFDYWFIEISGGSHSVMAWTGMLGTIVLIVTYLCLPVLNDRFGHLPFLVLALFVTGIGCGMTAFIKDPKWMTLPMCFRGVATAVSAQSAGAYLGNAVDKNQMATLQTIMAAIIYGVGNGAGSLLGGILIDTWSPYICYAVFSISSFVFCGLLIVSQLVTLKDDKSREL